MAVRSFLIAVAVAFGSQATGVSEAVACSAPCDQDDDEGRCPPTCTSCSCAPRLIEPTARTITVVPPDETATATSGPIEVARGVPADGFARDIAHVPIAA